MAVVYTVHRWLLLGDKEGEKIDRTDKEGGWISPTAIANKPRNVIKARFSGARVYWSRVRVFSLPISKLNRSRNKYLIRYSREGGREGGI